MRSFIFAVLLFLAASFCCLNLYAQSASVSGQVLDSSGAAVRGATVALINTETGVKLTTLSDSSGMFILPPVAPGRYRAIVTADKYASWIEHHLLLEVGAKSVLNPVLTVGSVSETVSVTAAEPEIKTEGSDLGTVTEPSLVANIPLDVRNPLQETGFAPGVTQTNELTAGTNATSQDTTNTFYINGTKQGESDILIDGATDTVFYDTHAAGAIPGLDAVREFQIYRAAYAPEFGHTGSAIQSYSIKSGTNQLHGGAWEYYRNAALDANGYNADAALQKKPSFQRNQFGFQLGGPVVIPKLYNGKDKTFFFGSYEELLDSTPGAGFTTTVPTALERTGDFSQTVLPDGSPLVIYDPSTTVQVPAGGTYTCPNGTPQTATQGAGYYRCQMYFNGKANVIDPSRLNPTAMALLAKYPLPNQRGVGGSDENNFFSDAPSTDRNYNFDIRLDHQFSDKHTVFGHFDYFDDYILYGAVFGNPSLTPQFSNDLIPGRNAILDHSWMISPSVIFDHHFSWAHMESHRGSVDPLGTGVFHIPAAAAPGITATFTPQVEAVNNQLGEIGNSEPLERNPNSVYQYEATLSWLKGIHNFKFGTDLRLYRDQLWDPQLLTVNTSRTFTGGPYANAPGGTTGDAVAELLLGQATVTSGYAPKVNFRHQYYAFFAQDTAKLTRRLTLTYGLRYSLESGDVAQGNELSYLDTTDPSPIASQVPSLPHLVGGVGIPGETSSGGNLQAPGKLHFEPRLGVAYSLDSNTVIHGGFGLFYHPTATWGTNPASFGFTRKSTSIDAAANGFSPLYNLSQPFPNGLPVPYGNNPSPQPGNNTGNGPLSIELGQNVSGNPYKQADAYQEVWSLDVQRALPSHFVVTATYTGSVGVHLYGALQLNQLPTSVLATGTAINQVVPNPFYGVITDPSSILSQTTIQQGYLQRAHPQFRNFELLNAGLGHANYQAGQLTVEHRLNSGLSLLLGYTYSKSIDNIGEGGTSASVQNIGCLSCERSIADLDQTNVLRISTVYELPFGPSKPLANHGPLSRLLGGWQLGGTYQYNTGQPVALTSPIQSASLNGGSVMRPTLVPGQSITQEVVGPNGELSSFNPKAFTETGPYAFGDAPRYLSNVRLPAFMELDALLQKSTPLNERMSLVIRFEALNALNNVVFGGPDTGVNDANFGFDPHTQQNNPRIAQASARLVF